MKKGDEKDLIESPEIILLICPNCRHEWLESKKDVLVPGHNSIACPFCESLYDIA